MIDISEIQLEIIKKILSCHVPNHVIWAFGSRVTGPKKQYADLDLAIISNLPLAPEVMGMLKLDFSDSDLPFKVDIVDWATTAPAFRKVIQSKYEVLTLG